MLKRRLFHVPLKPVRRDVLGEVIMLDQWQRLLSEPSQNEEIEGPDSKLKEILWQIPGEVSPRTAKVCASFMKWLGTNCGRAFLHDAKRMAELDFFRGKPEAAYVSAWAMENARKPGIDGGYRMIEHVLSQHSDQPVTDLTIDDHEVIETLVIWLANAGSQFLKVCEDEITFRLEAEREEQLTRWKQSVAQLES